MLNYASGVVNNNTGWEGGGELKCSVMVKNSTPSLKCMESFHTPLSSTLWKLVPPPPLHGYAIISKCIFEIEYQNNYAARPVNLQHILFPPPYVFQNISCPPYSNPPPPAITIQNALSTTIITYQKDAHIMKFLYLPKTSERQWLFKMLCFATRWWDARQMEEK